MSGKGPKKLTEAQRDVRDLAILDLLDEGVTQEEAARRNGVTRGLVAKMLRQIKDDGQPENSGPHREADPDHQTLHGVRGSKKPDA